MLRSSATPLTIALIGLLATLPAVDGSFLYDDHHYVLDNPAVVGDAPVLSSPLGVPEQALWRPLTVATYRAQWEPGVDARPFLVVNVALHVLASVAVLWLARRLGLGRGAGWLAAALFAAHPAHAESVAWITGRAELLATLGVLGAWIAHTSDRRGSTGVAAVLLGLAALSKENALAAPVIFAAADGLRGHRPLRWGRLALLGSVSAALFATRATVLPQVVPSEGPFLETDLAGRAIVALNVVGQALRLLAWPHPLRIEYHRDELALARPDTWLVLALAGLAVVWLWRAERRAACGLLLVPVCLATVSHLVPIGEPFAERFLYLPSVPFCLALGCLLARWCRLETVGARGLGPALAVTMLLVGGGVLASRAAIAVFRDELSLWSHAVAVAPELPLPHYNLGRELDERGHHLTRDRDRPGCRDELDRSLQLEPRHAFAGFAHQMLGNHDLGSVGHDTPNVRAAADHFRAAMELLPTMAVARINLAAVALDFPAAVPREEGLAALAPLLQAEDLDPEQRAAALELFRQLSGPAGSPEASTGTSSPDGS